MFDCVHRSRKSFVLNEILYCAFLKKHLLVADCEQKVYWRGLLHTVGQALISVSSVPAVLGVSLATSGSVACTKLTGYERSVR